MFKSRDRERQHFQSQLQSLLAQGKELPESLGILATAFDGELQPAIAAASKDAGGASFRALAEKQPDLFDPDVARLMQATGGSGLGAFFTSYRRFRLQAVSNLQSIRKRLLGGLIYFGYISMFSLCCLFVLTVFVLPKLNEVAQPGDTFAGAGTLFVWMFIPSVLLLGLALVWILLLMFPPYVTSAARLYQRGLKYVPGARSFLRSWIISLSLEHLALLLEAGVPIEGAMKTAEPPAPVLFPPWIARWIRISQRAGTLSSQVRGIAVEQDFEVFKHADRMITGYLIVAYLVFGFWIGFPIMRVYLPIFKLGGSI